MYGVELYAAVRLAVVDEGLSHHEAARRFGIDRRTVKKMLSYSAPPGYRRTKPVRRPKLDGFTGIVDAILEADTDPDVPRKQRHTAHRIFERLRDEHGFAGGYTIVKDYVRSRRQSTREAFVPLHHPPGHAQVDFGEAVVELRGQREKVAFFCLILPHSNVWFVKAYPRETTEAFLDGHVSAFAFLGGVPRSILYDNTTLAVARILGDGTRRRTQAFSHLQSHYLSLLWTTGTSYRRGPWCIFTPPRRYIFTPPLTYGRHWMASATTFDFLGFTHVWGRSRRGKDVVRQITAKGSFARALKSVHDWCKRHRHLPIEAQREHLAKVIWGHCAYYGLTGNGKRLEWFRYQVIRIWRKWLARRSRLRCLNWNRMNELLKRFTLPSVTITRSWQGTLSEPVR